MEPYRAHGDSVAQSSAFTILALMEKRDTCALECEGYNERHVAKAQYTGC